MAQVRSVTEVFEDHLIKRLSNNTEEDIATNYDEKAVLFTGTGVFHGHEGVRQSAKELASYIPENASFEYRHTLIEGDYAFLEWTANSKGRSVCDGADSFVIKNGKIVFQSIHYSVTKTVH